MLEMLKKHRANLARFWFAFCQLGGCIAFCSVAIDTPDVWRRLFAAFALNLALVGLAWVTIHDLEKRIVDLIKR